MTIVLTFVAFQQIFKKHAQLLYHPNEPAEIATTPLSNDGNSTSFYSIQPAPTEAEFVAAYPSAVFVAGLSPS